MERGGVVMKEVKRLSYWDKWKGYEIIHSLVEKYDEASNLLSTERHGANTSYNDDYIQMILECQERYGRGAYVLMDLLGDIDWAPSRDVRELLTSDNWLYKVEKKQYLSVLDSIISEKRETLDRLNEYAKRRIKPSDSETLKDAIKTYRAAAKRVEATLKTLDKTRKVYIAGNTL